MGLNFVPAYGFPSETGELFREYTDMLIAGDPSFKEYLVIQDYAGRISAHGAGVPCESAGMGNAGGNTVISSNRLDRVLPGQTASPSVRQAKI